MKRFRLIRRTRQTTEYSCGACAMQSVLGHWGREVDEAELMQRMGIFIRGENPATTQRLSDADFAALDFGSLGSITLLVAQFEGYLLPYPFLSELRSLWAGGIVRPDAYIFLRKDAAGKVAAIEGGNLEDAEDLPEVNALLAAIAGLARGGAEEAVVGAATAAREAGADFGLSAEEVQRIADKLPPGKSAVIVLVENLWERKFREAVGRHGGSLINQRWYGADTLARLGERLAAGRRGQEPAA